MKIKIAFSDFWKNFNPEDNWFYHFFKRHFEVELSDKPDFLIYSCYGRNFLKYKCPRIFYAPENRRPNFFECDYALTFDFLNHPRHFRLPLYGIWDGIEHNQLLQPKLSLQDFLKQKKEFCCMVVSNASAIRRIEFFNKLSAYKRVDSGGRYLNNIGGPVEDKMKFIENYRFVISFENESYPGYVTEKIYQPMFKGSIPIYWGSPVIEKDFNPLSFVNCHDYKDDDAIIRRIIELEENPDELEKMLQQPWFHGNQLPDCINEDKIAAFFNEIFTSQVDPVAVSWKSYYALSKRKWISLKRYANRYVSRIKR